MAGGLRLRLGGDGLSGGGLRGVCRLDDREVRQVGEQRHVAQALMGLAGAIEFIGGILFIIGLFTRPVAFIAAGFTAVAYWMAHAPQGFYPAQNGGVAAILFSFFGLQRRRWQQGND